MFTTLGKIFNTNFFCNVSKHAQYRSLTRLKIAQSGAVEKDATLRSFSKYTRAMATTTNNYKLREVEGDLFSAPEIYSLAHCVAADFGMGAGIAVKFKQTYGQVDKLLEQGVQSGDVAVLQDKNRYIYYLVTKPQSWGSPTYDSLRSSLTAMREHMRTNNVDKLAIPRIGCGIDGLEWDKVSAELNQVFGAKNLEIVVYNFVPK